MKKQKQIKKIKTSKPLHIKLKILIENDGTSISHLSRELKCTRSSIRHWLDGTRFPNYQSIEKLCIYFNVDYDYILPPLKHIKKED